VAPEGKAGVEVVLALRREERLLGQNNENLQGMHKWPREGKVEVKKVFLERLLQNRESRGINYGNK